MDQSQYTKVQGEILALRTLVGLTIGRLSQIATHEKGLLNVMADNAINSIDGMKIVGDPTIAKEVQSVAKSYVQDMLKNIKVTG